MKIELGHFQSKRTPSIQVFPNPKPNRAEKDKSEKQININTVSDRHLEMLTDAH